MKKTILFSMILFASLAAQAQEQRQAVCVCKESARIAFGVPNLTIPSVGVGQSDDEAFGKAAIDCKIQMGYGKGYTDPSLCTFSDVKAQEAQ